jgi:phosphoglycolate phosphatase
MRAPLSSTPRLVVFDWDGTLIDSIGAILECTLASLEEAGLPRVEEERVLALIGSSLKTSLEILAPEADEALRARVRETYRRLWFEDFHHRPVLIRGVEEALARLAERRSLLAVATAKSRRGLTADLERTGLARTFHASRTADETTPKPSPAMLLELLEELGVRPREALMVGDSVHDVEMAHNAGVPVVAVSSGAQPEENLRRAEPLDCLGSVAELVGWLDSGSGPLGSGRGGSPETGPGGNGSGIE